MRYKDGDEEFICTDDTWKGADSEIVFSDIYDGEVYDARLETEEWNKSGRQKHFQRIGFRHGHVTMVGANSPSSLASRSIRILLADEIDRYPATAGSEGNPLFLAAKRLTTFWNRREEDGEEVEG